SRGDRLAEALAEAGDDLRLLLVRARAQRRADDVQTSRQERRQIDVRARAAGEPDQHEASADAEAREVLLEVRAADRIEDHVDALAAGQLLDARGEVLALVVDRGGRAEIHAALALLGAARGHVAARAHLA